MKKRKCEGYCLKRTMGLVPHAYSAHYREWKREIMGGNREGALLAAEAHEAQFGYRRRKPRR
jgi:hypothetical protein